VHNLAWINGNIDNLEGATVSLEDRGYLLGDGIYEVIRVFNGKPFALEDHLIRLQNSAKAIKMELPYSLEDINNAIEQLIEKGECTEGYLYIQVTRGIAQRDHLFPPDAKPSMIMYIREMAPLPALEDIKPVKCITLPDERWLNCYIKTVNLLPNLLARQAAAEAGAVEAILYRQGGIVTEGTRSNLFTVIDGIVRTHPATNLILHGVTRKIVIDILKTEGVKVSETAITLEELKNVSEAWLTSTTMDVNPIGWIDECPVGDSAPGPICRNLMNQFRAKVMQLY